MVITPTLASTDSPCSALSVIYSDEGSVTGFRFYNRHPELLLVDTEVIAKAPKRQLVAGLGDGLATWFEARATHESHRNNVVGGKPLTRLDAGQTLPRHPLGRWPSGLRRH